jgi:hypothetical protein
MGSLQNRAYNNTYITQQAINQREFVVFTQQYVAFTKNLHSLTRIRAHMAPCGGPTFATWGLVGAVPSAAPFGPINYFGPTALASSAAKPSCVDYWLDDTARS